MGLENLVLLVDLVVVEQKVLVERKQVGLEIVHQFLHHREILEEQVEHIHLLQQEEEVLEDLEEEDHQEMVVVV
jgi:hypothetical protein